jgi:hypothetical protein
MPQPCCTSTARARTLVLRRGTLTPPNGSLGSDKPTRSPLCPWMLGAYEIPLRPIVESRRSRKSVSEIARECAPGPPGPAESSVFHDFARRGPTKEAHRRALNGSDGLQRSVAGQGHGQTPPVTLPRGASDQGKQAKAGNPRSPTPRGTHQGRGWGTHQGRDQGTPTGSDPGRSRGPRNRCGAARRDVRDCNME